MMENGSPKKSEFSANVVEKIAFQGGRAKTWPPLLTKSLMTPSDTTAFEHPLSARYRDRHVGHVGFGRSEDGAALRYAMCQAQEPI